MKLDFKVQPLSLLPNAMGVTAESSETPPPTKCHLSIKVTTSTRNMDATSESFQLLAQRLTRLLTQLLARRLIRLLARRLAQLKAPRLTQLTG